MHYIKLTKYVASWLLLGVSVLSGGLSTVAHASPFLPTYTGPQNPALALNSISVTFNGSVFNLIGQLQAPISTAPTGSLYVWGINRGAGTAKFFTSPVTSTNPDIGSNVLFDSVFIINPTGSSVINLFNKTAPTVVPTSDISIIGSTINATLPASLLPGKGFVPQSYTFDLWPRVGAGQNDQIAQFFGATNAINPINLQVAVVPEPAPWIMLVTGLAVILMLIRRQSSQTQQTGLGSQHTL